MNRKSDDAGMHMWIARSAVGRTNAIYAAKLTDENEDGSFACDVHLPAHLHALWASAQIRSPSLLLARNVRRVPPISFYFEFTMQIALVVAGYHESLTDTTFVPWTALSTKVAQGSTIPT